MSLRPAPWFGTSSSRRASVDPAQKKANLRPDLKLVEGGKLPRLERLTPRVRITSLVLTISVFLFGLVAFHVVLSQGQFKLEKLEAKASQQQEQYERNRLQVAQLESPSRITSEATERLGLVPADTVTPVTPEASDMPTTPSGQSGQQASSTDPGQWSKVKPHLSSTTK